MSVPSVPSPDRCPIVNESRRLLLSVALDGYRIGYDFHDDKCSAEVRVFRPSESGHDWSADLRNGKGEKVIGSIIECGGTPDEIEIEFADRPDRRTALARVVEALTIFYDVEPPHSPNRKVLRMFYRRAVKLLADDSF
jgi:hypothetical protein